MGEQPLDTDATEVVGAQDSAGELSLADWANQQVKPRAEQGSSPEEPEPVEETIDELSHRLSDAGQAEETDRQRIKRIDAELGTLPADDRKQRWQSERVEFRCTPEFKGWLQRFTAFLGGYKDVSDVIGTSLRNTAEIANFPERMPNRVPANRVHWKRQSRPSPKPPAA